jgi:hypothetical protein
MAERAVPPVRIGSDQICGLVRSRGSRLKHVSAFRRTARWGGDTAWDRRRPGWDGTLWAIDGSGAPHLLKPNQDCLAAVNGAVSAGGDLYLIRGGWYAPADGSRSKAKLVGLTNWPKDDAAFADGLIDSAWDDGATAFMARDRKFIKGGRRSWGRFWGAHRGCPITVLGRERWIEKDGSPSIELRLRRQPASFRMAGPTKASTPRYGRLPGSAGLCSTERRSPRSAGSTADMRRVPTSAPASRTGRRPRIPGSRMRCCPRLPVRIDRLCQARRRRLLDVGIVRVSLAPHWTQAWVRCFQMGKALKRRSGRDFNLAS